MPARQVFFVSLLALCAIRLIAVPIQSQIDTTVRTGEGVQSRLVIEGVPDIGPPSSIIVWTQAVPNLGLRFAFETPYGGAGPILTDGGLAEMRKPHGYSVFSETLSEKTAVRIDRGSDPSAKTGGYISIPLLGLAAGVYRQADLEFMFLRAGMPCRSLANPPGLELAVVTARPARASGNASDDPDSWFGDFTRPDPPVAVLLRGHFRLVTDQIIGYVGSASALSVGTTSPPGQWHRVVARAEHRPAEPGTRILGSRAGMLVSCSTPSFRSPNGVVPDDAASMAIDTEFESQVTPAVVLRAGGDASWSTTWLPVAGLPGAPFSLHGLAPGQVRARVFAELAGSFASGALGAKLPVADIHSGWSSVTLEAETTVSATLAPWLRISSSFEASSKTGDLAPDRTTRFVLGWIAEAEGSEIALLKQVEFSTIDTRLQPTGVNVELSANHDLDSSSLLYATVNLTWEREPVPPAWSGEFGWRVRGVTGAE